MATVRSVRKPKTTTKTGNTTTRTSRTRGAKAKQPIEVVEIVKKVPTPVIEAKIVPSRSVVVLVCKNTHIEKWVMPLDLWETHFNSPDWVKVENSLSKAKDWLDLLQFISDRSDSIIFNTVSKTIPQYVLEIEFKSLSQTTIVLKDQKPDDILIIWNM